MQRCLERITKKGGYATLNAKLHIRLSLIVLAILNNERT